MYTLEKGKIMNFLDSIRRPQRISLKSIFLGILFSFSLGLLFGVVSKQLDLIPSSSLPSWLSYLDLRNFLSRMGIWLFCGLFISIKSKTAWCAMMNVFAFFAAGVSSYFIYTVIVAEFFPQSYMMIWIGFTFISPLLAFVSWYSKGEGWASIIIASLIIMMMSRQAFAIGIGYVDVRAPLELLVWMFTFVLLYKSPQQTLKIFILGLILTVVFSSVHFYGGMF